MKRINDITIVGYDKNGNEIEAERLQKWAYNQIASAPELLEACKFVGKFYQDNFSIMPVSFQTVDDICQQAIANTEGGVK